MMNTNPDQAKLIHRATIALTQLHRLLQQATDILADLHSLYLLHTRQVDNHFQRSFPPLPPPPSFTIPVPSPTSSCDSAPAHRLDPTPRKPTASLDSSSLTPTPQPLHPKKRRQPAPPLNSQANWDDWDGDADCRLVELKTDPQLRPNWSYVARRVGFFFIEQRKARWQEIQEWQPIHDASTPPHPPSPHPSPAISPAPTSPAETPPATPLPLHSEADFSDASSPPHALPSAAADFTAAARRTNSEDSHPELADDQFLGSYFV